MAEGDSRGSREPLVRDARDPRLQLLLEREALLSEAEGIAQVGSYLWELGSPPLWSDGFFRILGYAPGSVSPSAELFHARVHPDDQARVLAAHGSVREGHLSDIEYRIVRADTGEVRHLRGTGRVYRASEAGHAVRLVGALLDITEAKRAARRDEEALHTMRTAERLAKVGTFIVQFDPMQTEWSDGLYELSGLTDRDADLQTRFNLIHPDDRDRHAAWFRAVTAGETGAPIRTRFVRPDGEVRHVLTHAARVRFESDGIERVVGTSVDVSEQVRLEEQLRHAAKMEAVGTLAAGVAHDFNNYLMVISGCLEMLSEAADGAGTLHEVHQHATHATMRCMELTQQMLAFARRRPAQRRQVDLAEAIGRIAPLLQPSLGRDVLLSLSVPEAPVIAHLDAAHLEQVLANLAINGRDAIHSAGTREGRIEIALDVIELEAPQRFVPEEVGPGRWARVRVIDNGAGIRAEDLPRIFDPYFTTKSVGRGTGLGLAAVYGAVTQHGGHVTVESRIGDGTCFTLWLPAVDAGDTSGSKSAAPPRLWPAGLRRVMVVDDMPEVRRVTALSLRAAGFRVIEACDGLDAMEQLGAHPIDLVLSDVRMPKMNGLRLLEALRERRPELPVVLMTGFSETPVADVAVPVLHKPVSSEDLIHAVQACLHDES